MPFQLDILTPDPERRRPILDVLEAALEAVDPHSAVHKSLRSVDNHLVVDGRTYDLTKFDRVFVLGAGKAGAPMTQAVEQVLDDRITAGLVVVKSDHTGPTSTVELAEAGHPRPDRAGAQAGARILEMAHAAQADDLVIVLLSGGGSALLTAPAPGVSLTDLQKLTDALLACGATINEINCLRKHCSAVKGGQLARAVAPATLITLVLSDVVGSPLDVIASGPTVPDSSTWQDASAIVKKYGLGDALPATIAQRLQQGLSSELPDTPTADDPLFKLGQIVVIGDNLVAAKAALKQATEIGFNALLLSTFVEGEATQIAKVAVALGREIQASGHPIAAPACLILGGETTVTLGAQPGKGGRNQELALAAALALADEEKITVVSLATDGTDGPTDSAGGIGDGRTVERGRLFGMSASDYLERHDAYPYLLASADLLRTGPTQTNVNDLIFVFVDP